MADTAIAITAGSGTNVDTRTEGTNGNHRQVIVIGDPATNAGVAPVDATEGLMVRLGATDNAVLDAIQAALEAIQTSSAAVQAAVEVLDNIVSGAEAQVDIVAALPAGSNTIGAVTNSVLTDAGAGDYETVAASQTEQALGATGATGDYLSGVLIIPATTSPGAVSIKDGSGSAITVFAGGTDSVIALVPFFVPLGIKSGAGAWQVTTGADVSAIGVGNFT